jgi:hypothetical protein
MIASPCCPFCGSHRLTVTNETERLSYKCCDRCLKQWAEPNIVDDRLCGEQSSHRPAGAASTIPTPQSGRHRQRA